MQLQLASGTGIDVRLGEKRNIAAHVVDGLLQRFAARRCRVCRAFKTFCAAFRLGRFALLLLGEAQALAGLPCVRKAQRLCDLLGAPEIRLLAAADPAAGAAAPQKSALDLALLLVGKAVIIGLVEVQLQLAGFPVAHIVAFALRGGGEAGNELVRGDGQHLIVNGHGVFLSFFFRSIAPRGVAPRQSIW